MRTTIDLPDELFRRAKARAALDGLKLKDLIAAYVAQGLDRNTRPSTADETPRRGRSPLPIMIAATGKPIPALTHEQIEQIELEQELAGYDRSAGR